MTTVDPGNPPVGTVTPAETIEPDVTQKTLETMPGRALSLLRAIGTDRSIRRAMNRKGYTPRDHQEGWGLIGLVSGQATQLEEPEALNEDARDAMVEIDSVDEDIFRLVEATLQRRFPVQAAFVLKGIGPAKGANAVVNLGLLLDRLDALDNAADRTATRDQDRAATAVLAGRTLTTEERARLRSLIQRAQAGEVVPAEEVEPIGNEEQYVGNLMRLRAWYLEWSQIGRVAVKRRDQLIKMGLANRRTGSEEEEATPGVPPVIPIPMAP